MCKKLIKNSQPFVKKMKNVRTPQGGFFWLTLYTCIILSFLFLFFLLRPVFLKDWLVDYKTVSSYLMQTANSYQCDAVCGRFKPCCPAAPGQQPTFSGLYRRSVESQTGDPLPCPNSTPRTADTYVNQLSS